LVALAALQKKKLITGTTKEVEELITIKMQQASCGNLEQK